MLQTVKKIIFALGFICTMQSLLVASAASPTLLVSPTGDGNNVTVSVTNADGNTPVVLYYTSSRYTGTQSQNIGNTNTNGTFSVNVSTSAYGILTTSQVYALINGYQTPYVTWPYTAASSIANSSITLSKANPVVPQGQTILVTLSGTTGGYYLSSNSASSIVQASISGNILTLSGSQQGQAILVICSTSASCSNQIVTVEAGNTTSGTIYLTQNNLTVTVGQTAQIVATGGVSPYSTFYDGTNRVTTSVNGTVITVRGVAVGNTSVTICGVSGGCAPLNVNVVQGTTPSTALTINIPVIVGQTFALPLSGGNGAYYISTPITSPFNATISGNTLYIVGTAIGTETVTICSSSTLCSTISIIVSSSPTITKPSTVAVNPVKHIFTVPLYTGLSGDEVLKLQQRLAEDGYLYAIPNGYYGPATTNAVKSFQRDHDLSPFGNVGPGTRAALNR
jgi:hypothetical protein